MIAQARSSLAYEPSKPVIWYLFQTALFILKNSRNISDLSDLSDDMNFAVNIEN